MVTRAAHDDEMKCHRQLDGAIRQPRCYTEGKQKDNDRYASYTKTPAREQTPRAVTRQECRHSEGRTEAGSEKRVREAMSANPQSEQRLRRHCPRNFSSDVHARRLHRDV